MATTPTKPRPLEAARAHVELSELYTVIRDAKGNALKGSVLIGPNALAALGKAIVMMDKIAHGATLQTQAEMGVMFDRCIALEEQLEAARSQVVGDPSQSGSGGGGAAAAGAGPDAFIGLEDELCRAYAEALDEMAEIGKLAMIIESTPVKKFVCTGFEKTVREIMLDASQAVRTHYYDLADFREEQARKNAEREA